MLVRCDCRNTAGNSVRRTGIFCEAKGHNAKQKRSCSGPSCFFMFCKKGYTVYTKSPSLDSSTNINKYRKVFERRQNQAFCLGGGWRTRRQFLSHRHSGCIFLWHFLQQSYHLKTELLKCGPTRNMSCSSNRKNTETKVQRWTEWPPSVKIDTPLVWGRKVLNRSHLRLYTCNRWAGGVLFPFSILLSCRGWDRVLLLNFDLSLAKDGRTSTRHVLLFWKEKVLLWQQVCLPLRLSPVQRPSPWMLAFSRMFSLAWKRAQQPNGSTGCRMM